MDTGQPFDTPALVVDERRLDANIARIQEQARASGVAVRPHAKTHKSVEIARRQLAAGAAGITVATVAEAEVLAGGGIDDLFIAYPVVATGGRGARLRALAAETRLCVGVDSVAGVELLAAAGLTGVLTVRIEVDSGNARTGAAPHDVPALLAAARGAGLNVTGAFTHGGHGYAGPDSCESAGDDEVTTMSRVRPAFTAASIHHPELSVGSTPTFRHSTRPAVTETRPGTYVYGDRQQTVLGACRLNDVALTVATSVVSARPGVCIIDAGAKALSKDRAEFLEGYGTVLEHPGAVIDALWDHHGRVVLPAGVAPPAVGSLLHVIPNHVCPVVNLFPTVWFTAPGRPYRQVPVDAQAANS